MSGWSKLFSSILYSTIWREPNHVRIVWITMLAMCDRRGIVEASIPGLSDAAKVSLEQCLNALEVLQSPDEFSRSKEYEGRRIIEVSGGWKLLNYLKYRGNLQNDIVREQTRLRVQKHRQLANCNDEKRNVTGNGDPDPDPDPEAEEEKKHNCAFPKRDGVRKSKQQSFSDDFLRFWKVYPKKRGKRDAWKAWQQAKVNLPAIEDIVQIIDRHLISVDWIQEGGKYIPYPATWIRKGCWEDEPIIAKAEFMRNVFPDGYERMTAQEQAFYRSQQALDDAMSDDPKHNGIQSTAGTEVFLGTFDEGK